MIDRTIAPPIILPDALNIPAAIESRTESGIRLWSIAAGTQPLVRLSLVFEAGTRYQSGPFVASSMLNMLSEGTALHTAAEISEMLDFYGIYYDTSIDRDYAIITVSCLERFLDRTLALLGQIVLHPIFSEQELAIYASKRKQQLMIDREKPAQRARELFSAALFGAEHPYGVSSPESAYDSLTVDQLRDFYRSHITADGVFAVASGAIDSQVRAKLETFLEQIPTAVDPLQGREPAMPTPRSESLVREKRDGALQSSIRIGKLLFTKEHPDFNAMQVVATVLGGYFGSRLVSNLREDKGYTYGIYSAVVNMQRAGYIAIATDVTAEATDQSVTEIFAEIERLRSEPIPLHELDMVRNIIVGEMMRILDGPFGIADVTIENVQCGMTNSALEAFFAELRTITPERLRDLAQKWLDPQGFTTVIVGA